MPPAPRVEALPEQLLTELARRVEQRLTAELPRLIESTLRDLLAEKAIRRPAPRLIAKAAEPKDPERQAALEQALLTLPGRGQWAVLLPLELINDAWTGEAWSKKSGQEAFVLRRWQYQSESGLLGLDAPDEDSSGATPR